MKQKLRQRIQIKKNIENNNLLHLRDVILDGGYRVRTSSQEQLRQTVKSEMAQVLQAYRDNYSLLNSRNCPKLKYHQPQQSIPIVRRKTPRRPKVGPFSSDSVMSSYHKSIKATKKYTNLITQDEGHGLPQSIKPLPRAEKSPKETKMKSSNREIKPKNIHYTFHDVESESTEGIPRKIQRTLVKKPSMIHKVRVVGSFYN